MSESDNSFETSEPVETVESSVYMEEAKSDSKAFGIISLVCGILSVVCCCTLWGAVVLGVTAIVLGILSISKRENTNGMAVAGIICGGIGLVFIIVMMIAAGNLDKLVNTSNSEAVTEYVERIIEAIQ